jgi:hypothetical protein
MIQQADQIMMPKTSMHQNCMQAVEDAIQDNIVGLTPELAREHLEYVVDPNTDITIVKYKGKDRIMFGFRNQEFFIEHKGAVSA